MDPLSEQSGSQSPDHLRTAARFFNELRLPLVCRGVLQSFRPTNLALGFGAALSVFGGAWVLDRAWVATFNDESTPFAMLGVFWPTGGPSMFESRMDAFLRALQSQTIGPLVVLGAAVLIASLFLGALARSAVLNVSANRRIGWLVSLRFALKRAPALVGAAGIPLVVLALMVGLVKLFGLILLTAGFTQPIGGVLFGLPLLLGVAASLLAVGFAVFHSMLAPATAVDQADGMDAIQRAAGYLVARPIRLVLYLIVFAVLLRYSYAFVQTVCRMAIDFASSAIPEAGLSDGEAEFTAGAIGFWIQVLWLVFIGWVVSFYGTASTALYLIMREACDGQDVTAIVPTED